HSLSIPFALNASLTTPIYTLSLHDALPICRLTEEEFEYIKKHSEFGWMVLRSVEGFEEASLILLHHHERFDGRGYPGELSGTQIDRKSTRLNSSHVEISYAVFCLKKKKKK